MVSQKTFKRSLNVMKYGKYREHIKKVDWESCKKVLNNEQRKEWLMSGGSEER
ncbi:hypothetical protein Athe_1597 [Caldicellulosiruptor bescii DSM 6725]|uniref:Uncharacterized protein n=1 Tax=Caldicellulosiruptor bescii (strain ATCC BAA-1888 / DSM 6725 / KCTC 15123 / Z-1320) TaxID=521460 RepID=B9MK33_CALBD|nr:hypothetical protein [Caldicellulosiruptor bescii]ACM60691.1 hypothetical protein Athe_1597 [Caldicellulosiruptor bescii DSM 6725]